MAANVPNAPNGSKWRLEMGVEMGVEMGNSKNLWLSATWFQKVPNAPDGSKWPFEAI